MLCEIMVGKGYIREFRPGPGFLKVSAYGASPPLGATVEMDPRTGQALKGSRLDWPFDLSNDAISKAEAVRRYARARTGVNRLSAMLRDGWSRGLLLTRRQLFPLMPPHIVWLKNEAWTFNAIEN